MNDLFIQQLQQLQQLLEQLSPLSPYVHQAAQLASQSLLNGGKIMFCGNGGSAADAQHMASELTGRLVHDRRPLAALALTTDTSALTSIGNDYEFDEIFSRQLNGLGKKGDVLIAISTSGQSRNVVRAAQTAHQLGIKVIGLLGRDGGALHSLCDVSIVVPSPITARIQEVHQLMGHSLCHLIEHHLGLNQQ